MCQKPVYRLQGSRREILRYGSLGVAVSCLLFTVANWKVKVIKYDNKKLFITQWVVSLLISVL